jgi:chemotaxis family two-component system response regulator Rcp1
VTSIELPRKSGLALIAELKGDPALRSIPVIVLSLHEAPAIIRKSYALGANSYIIKPHALAAFFKVVHTIVAYGFTAVTLAPPPPVSRRSP